MLHRLLLRDVVIVTELEVELGQGFTVLTGETGAGKSILIDALQLALGQRADAGVVREGATRAEVSAEFDTPASLHGWLEENGFAREPLLLLRRVVDAQGDSAGRSRAWVNGSPATLAQLRQAAEHLVDIHGQHAWQSLTRPAAVRGLLDSLCGAEGQALATLATLWQHWRQAQAHLDAASAAQGTLAVERERLLWQIGELDKLAPAAGEWDAINAEHQRLGHSQALLEGARTALAALSEDEPGAAALTARAATALHEVQRFDPELTAVLEVLAAAQSQLDDAVHSLRAYLGRRETKPERLGELDARIGQWVSLSRRYKRSAADLPELLKSWRAELAQLNASTDLAALEQAAQAARQAWRDQALRVSALRKKAAPKLAAAVTQAMQSLGMAGGRFDVSVATADETTPPHAHGLDTVEFLVAGHAGSTPRPLGKVASGGELSRLALAIAVSTASGLAAKAEAHKGPSNAGPMAMPALIFDEIDAGVGGTVADSVGRLMKQLGASNQVMAVTHLAQVAACADAHFVVSKALHGKQTLSAVKPVHGAARVAEVARMLGGESTSAASHAQALLLAANLGDTSPGPSPSPAGTIAKPTKKSASGAKQ